VFLREENFRHDPSVWLSELAINQEYVGLSIMSLKEIIGNSTQSISTIS